MRDAIDVGADDLEGPRRRHQAVSPDLQALPMGFGGVGAPGIAGAQEPGGLVQVPGQHGAPVAQGAAAHLQRRAVGEASRVMGVRQPDVQLLLVMLERGSR